MSTLPNLKALHALADTHAGTSKAHVDCVNIDGPAHGTYTSYRLTADGKAIVLQAADRGVGQGELFTETAS